MIVGGIFASPSVARDPVALAKGATQDWWPANAGGEAVPADSGGCGAVAAIPAAATAEPAPKPPVPELSAKAGADKSKEGVGEALKGLFPN